MTGPASTVGLHMVLHAWACLRHLVLAAVLTLGACSSLQNPNLYTIAPVRGAERGNAPKLISLQQVVVARYLERSQIVRSSDGYRLDVMANDWWGEPLGSMLDRILVQELSQRLPQSTVFSENSAIATSPDATVEVTIQRLDRNSEGAVVLQAQLGVSMRRRTAPVLRSFRTQNATILATLTQQKQSLVDQIANEVRHTMSERERLAAQISGLEAELAHLAAEQDMQRLRINLLQETVTLVQFAHAEKIQSLRNELSSVEQRIAEVEGRRAHVLRASMRRRTAPVLRSFRTQVALPTPDMSGQAAASSGAVGQLADEIALMLSQGMAAR
jgi:uncharacterized lipoprotein YmbA